MRRKTIFLVLMILMTGSSFVQAQDGGGNGGFNYANELSQRASIPQSPEAAAFARYGDVAVNMYAGTPNIQVPIYTHKGREFDLSLGLTYDASGIKVNQLPTPVGLGWNFDVGGRISRVVNGLPDDFISANSVGAYTSWYTASLKTDMVEYAKNEYRFGEGYGGSKTYGSYAAAENYIEFLEKIHQQEYETQPDMYMVNAPGLNEAFVFDLETKTPYALYNPNTIITVVSGNLTTANNGGVTTFKVITDNGTQYFFDAVEQTENVKDNDAEQSHYHYGSRVRFMSSWYLTKIISPLGKDTYEFEYTPYTDYRNDAIINVVTEQTTIVTGPEEDWTHQTSRANTETKFFNREIISRIIHNDKVIVTVDTESQFDGGPDVAVTGITTYSDGTLTAGTIPMKEFDLEYSYFKTTTSTSVNLSNELNLRLKLDRVVVKDATSQEINDYNFEYHNQYEMPSLTTYGQDYLGYYNGQNTNASLVSRTYSNSDQYPTSLGYTLSGLTNGANRNVNHGFAKRGLLHKITYPTGGHTTFEYEQAQLRYPEVNEQTQTINKINLIHSPSSLPPLNTNQCNMQNNSTAITANVATQSFEIASGEDGTHFLEYSKSGTPNTTSLFSVPRQAVLIKKEDPTITYSWGDVFDANCEILINPSFLIWEATSDVGTQNVSFTLGVGHYQVLIPIYDTGYSKTITIDGPDPILVTTYIEKPRAGIRVKMIKDYNDATTLTKQKEYEYILSRQISNPIFEYLTNERRNPDTDLTDPSPEPEEYQLLHRVAQPINGDIEHIVYSTVTEKIIDIDNPSESLSKTYSFKTPSPSQGIYGKGSYQTPIAATGGSFSSSNYSKLPSFGSNKKQVTPVTETHSTFTSERLHYQTFGLAVAPIGRNSVLYPTIQDVTGNDDYQIVMLTPKFTTNNAGAPPTPGPPNECNGDENCRPELARLMLHKTNIYGYHGAEVSQMVTTTDGVTTSTQYTYTDGDRRYPKTMETTGTGSNSQKTEYHYPFEMSIANTQTVNGNTTYTLTDGTVFTIKGIGSSGPGPNNAISLIYSQLINGNMLGQPVLIQQFDGASDDIVSGVLTTYRSDKQPQHILSAKEEDMFESRMVLEQYANDNLVQARQTDGTPVSFIWGYDNRYVVAKISNVTYSSLPLQIVADIKTYSDTGNQSALLNSLETLQNDPALANSMMTYYTYIPNVGVTTMTDETGYRMQYFYDDLQRLDRVEDQQGNVLSQNKYNYKN